MEKEFIPYEQALALKKLGFDEPCFAFYNGRFLDYKIQGGDICAPYLSTENRGECPNVPTFSQAFRWFREKYELDSFVNAEWKQMVKVGYYFNAGDYYSPQPSHLTYEEAELECLKKLIEIVINKQKRL
jgi:hypothetical protein